MKTCSKCQTEKELIEFNKEASRKDGLYPWCKVCLKEHRAARYVKRPKYFLIHNKICSFCKEDKPRAAFRTTSSNNLVPRCLKCEEDVRVQTEQNRRRCGACKQWRPLEEFYKSRRDGRHSTCIPCGQQALPNTYEKRRNASLVKYFGITLEQYKELLHLQNYVCPVCTKPLDQNKLYSHPVDHAHSGPNEGKIRAIVHDRCNRFVLWKHAEGADLRRAADLIDRPLTNWTVPTEYLKSRKKKRKKRVLRSRK